MTILMRMSSNSLPHGRISIASGYHALAVEGRDAGAFLQAQLSADLAPSAQQHPTVFAITRLVAELHACGSLQFYIDCHAHSNKRGCFLFGNAMQDAEAMGQNVTYAKCVEANSRWVRAHTKAPARTQRPPRAHTRNALPAPSL